MRIAFLIKQIGEKAELVTHGNVVELKQKFLSVELKKDETLLLLGTDIRPKRRGSNCIDTYLATVEKENEAMRQAEIKKQDALKKAKPAEKAPDKDASKKADAGKDAEILAIKAAESAKHKKLEPKKTQKEKENEK